MKHKYKSNILKFRQKYVFLDQTVAGMGMDTETLVGRDAGLVDGTYVNENNI